RVGRPPLLALLIRVSRIPISNLSSKTPRNRETLNPGASWRFGLYAPSTQISVILNYSELDPGCLCLDTGTYGYGYRLAYPRTYTLLFYSLRIPPLAQRLPGLGLISRLPFHPSLGDLLRPAYNGFRLYRLSYPQPSHNDLP
ncbi:hypothetical protein L249_8792, partial [Ophiocordyceps polyrhachis-furcata BCC 54312]